MQRLANGARVVSVNLPDAPLVCLDFWCQAGSVFEAAGESGMAHFLEHMVFKGSAHLQPGEFDRRVEALGGSSNAATGFDDVHYHLLIPPDGAVEALELLLDLVLEPRLDDQAFQMERQVVLEELAQSEDQPEEVALQQLLGAGCPQHAYGEPILGRRDQLLAQTPEAMAAFHRRLYTADRCLLILSGCLDPGAAHTVALQERLAASSLARLAPAATGRRALPPLAVRPGEHRLRLPRLESARLMMLWELPAAADLHGVMGADLLTTLLAEGRRSRLVDRLRERLRLVESIDLDLHVLECGSLGLLEAIAEEEDLPAIRREIEAVLLELAAEEIPPEEWGRSRRLVANGYRFGLESAGGVAGTLGSQHLWGHGVSLDAPLRDLEGWDAPALVREVLPLLAPERACVLEAVPA
ncbi:pitrilysin family protein [Cyanobium sp. CH-040]|uniref:M16 family metallopeptidase n=1 Tax=Cyanobium sp. CH-040 TaxID=2823708 RepID=UPI0020CD5385|nr:pitrilysin family protein [Cyanobium sp. CH-040]